MNTGIRMSKLSSFAKGTIISLSLFIFPITDTYAEYYLVYGPPPPVCDFGCSGCGSCGSGCARHRIRHRACHRVRHGCRRSRLCCPRRACGRDPACTCFTVVYTCPPPRPMCGFDIPVEDTCGGSCGGYYSHACGGGCSPCGASMPEAQVFMAQPIDYPEVPMSCDPCNYDMATGDDNPCCNPDMQINY